MKGSVLFSSAAALVFICVALSVYFLIPGIYHPYISLHSEGGIGLVDPARHPALVKSAHRIYAAGFFVLALIFAAVAYIMRPKKGLKAA